MSAETLRPLAGPASPGADAPDRATARMVAHRLVQQVQVRDTGDEVAEAIAAAESSGWSEVVRVLMYAELVKAWIHGHDDRAELMIKTLHDRALRDGDNVLLASALASRAEYRYAHVSASEREQANRDLARAVALLEAGDGRAQERGTAYIDCGLAYRQRELWELEQQMYDRAAALLPDCEEPLLERALHLNQALVNVHTACNLHELGERQELRALWERVTDATGGHGAGPKTGSNQTSPDVFAVEARVARHVMARLVGESPAEQSATLDMALEAARHPYEQPEHGMLRLADALDAAGRGAWDEVAGHAATARLLFDEGVGAPVIAVTLRLATQADIAMGSVGSQSAMDYCDWSARRRWDARLQQLAAARASLEVEQLRMERDEHAHWAHVDALTGLANRRGYARHVERLLANHDPADLGVLVVDIDAFKQVNDTCGHSVGDAVLVQVGQVLASCSRAVDLVARLGGDEFVVLLHGMDIDATKRRGTDMLERLALLDWSKLATGLQVSISIGAATGFSDNPDPLLRRADAALYRTKRRGGGGISLCGD